MHKAVPLEFRTLVLRNTLVLQCTRMGVSSAWSITWNLEACYGHVLEGTV